MSDDKLKPMRVMHLVSADGARGATQQSLFMPMLTRMPKQRVKALVVSLAPNAVPGAVLRQSGIPVYDVALSRQRFSLGAFGQLVKTARAFRPEIIQAWGYTAQVVASWLRARCDWDPRVVWSVANTVPLAREAGFLDRYKLKRAAKAAKRVDRIVYTSSAAASAHRRIGWPEDGHAIIPLGVDPMRFKPDLAARRKLREQLGIDASAFVVGMVAPFQPEYDHTTLLKAVGELIKTNPNVCVLLAGHGVQKGNAPLMALVGGGTLGARTHLLGEWSDVSSFYNACDVACSSALTDGARMSLVAAMLCGIPCVGTGMGAQGEVIGPFGVAIEHSSPAALIRGITRVMQMTAERRLFMAQGARNHALANFVSVRSLQKYLQLYCDLLGRPLAAAAAVPAPDIDPTLPAAAAEQHIAAVKPAKKIPTGMSELSDPDSLESRFVSPVKETKVAPEGDVLAMFESSLAQQADAAPAASQDKRAASIADQDQDLLAPDMLSLVESTQPQGASAPEPEARKSAHSESAAKSFSESGSFMDTTTLFIAAPVAPSSAGQSKPPASSRETATSNASAATPADSATVPAIAIDEILSATAQPSQSSLDVAAQTKETFQLELLPDPPMEKKAAG